ncbi:GGDEF domain-containing protein [Novosphingobium sp.]|uniref:GGDEF domain-containing protein n=1 Tax=Novosphingobium sp. TaxID=1874826 RepID=UPI00333ED892
MITTLVILEGVSLASGIDVPRVYWAVAVLCPLVLSTIISGRLIHQSETLNELYAELQRAHEQLKIAAQRDPMTDVLNRGAFLVQIGEMRSTGVAGWLVLIDVDHFKVINDRHGHETGDEALRQIARLLREAARAGDLIGRLGGEEFGLYLPRTTAAEAWALTERVRLHVAQSPAYVVNGRPHHVTISLGLAMERSPAESLKDILHRADMAMYRAKDEGRNRIAAAA